MNARACIQSYEKYQITQLLRFRSFGPMNLQFYFHFEIEIARMKQIEIRLAPVSLHFITAAAFVDYVAVAHSVCVLMNFEIEIE